jgi:c(7)-type cytochrome triheme protein
MKSSKACFTGLAVFLAFGVLPDRSGFAAGRDGGFIAFPAAGNAGPVLFSHRAHSDRKGGFSCVRCHVPASAGAMPVTMDEIRKGRECGACHDGKTGLTDGHGAASSIQNCGACHMPAGDIIIALNRMDPVAFSHARHMGVDSKTKVYLSNGFSCSSCHPALFERVAKGPIGMEVPHENGGCAQCHNGKKRTDGMPAAFAADTRCLTCHRFLTKTAEKPPKQPS